MTFRVTSSHAHQTSLVGSSVTELAVLRCISDLINLCLVLCVVGGFLFVVVFLCV